MDAEARHQHLCQSYQAEQAHAGDGKQRALVPRFRTLHFAYRYRHSRRKREDAKNEVIAEMRGKFEQLGLSFEEVMGLDSGRIGRRNRGTQLP
jgi:hypothetical protein